MPKIPFDGSKVDLWPTRVDHMDDYTKETIADLLGPSKATLSRESRDRAMREKTAAESMARVAKGLDMGPAKERLAKERLARDARWKTDFSDSIRGDAYDSYTASPKPAPVTPPYTASHMTYVTPELLAMSTAAISVNTSKACIVLNTSNLVSDALIHAFELIDPKRSQIIFNAQLRIWEIHPGIMAQVKPILAKMFKTVQVVGVPKAIPATKFDQLLTKLDKDDKAKIYKLLAMKYHTDRGGAHDTMVLINQVFKES